MKKKMEKKRERERGDGKPEDRLSTIENKLKFAGGEVGRGGWVRWVRRAVVMSPGCYR